MDHEKSVLIVDDDANIRDFLSVALEDEGYAVSQAENGAVALQVVDQHPPKVILLDMRMPVMDGWEFARRFRAEHDGAAPIVVMTAAPDAKKRCREINGDACLPKPFELDELLTTIEQQFARPGVN